VQNSHFGKLVLIEQWNYSFRKQKNEKNLYKILHVFFIILCRVCVRDYKYWKAILNDNHRTDIWNTDSGIRSANVSA